MTFYSIGRYSGAVMEMSNTTCMQHSRLAMWWWGSKRRHGEAEKEKVLRPRKAVSLEEIPFAGVGIHSFSYSEINKSGNNLIFLSFFSGFYTQMHR